MRRRPVTPNKVTTLHQAKHSISLHLNSSSSNTNSHNINMRHLHSTSHLHPQSHHPCQTAMLATMLQQSVQ